MTRCLIIAAAALVAGVLNVSMALAQSPPAAVQADMTVQERLAACERRYAEAKTYRDDGEVVTEYSNGVSFTERKPFSTAFERGGRFHWEFRGTAGTGFGPTHTFTVWSQNQKTFHTYWTLNREKGSHRNIRSAMAGPTGISGGSATAIIPLLFNNRRTWRMTEITNAKEAGSETIDDHDCVKIEGDSLMGRTTLWLDETHAIRKVYYLKEIDPATLPKLPGGDAPRIDKFTTNTTITIKPTFDEPIDDEQFAPPAEAE